MIMAPRSPWGEPTAKFHAAREVINRHFPLPPLNMPPPIPRRGFGEVSLDEAAPLLAQAERIAQPVEAAAPLTMEELDLDAGFVLYRTTLEGPLESVDLNLKTCHDRAQIFLDGESLGVFERDQKSPAAKLALSEGEHVLEILVENIARINYGPHLAERKGIVDGVRLGYQFHFGWTHFALPLDNLELLEYETSQGTPKGPCVFRGQFEVDELADTFVDLTGWKKGAVWINGFNSADSGHRRSADYICRGLCCAWGKNECCAGLHDAPAERRVTLSTHQTRPTSRCRSSRHFPASVGKRITISLSPEIRVDPEFLKCFNI